MFNPQRFAIARKRRKFTQKRLAEVSGITAVQVSRIASGACIPEPETVSHLANALGYPESFFFGDDLDELLADSVSFRSLSGMTAKERDAALSAGALAYLVDDWVTARFNLPAPALVDMSYERDPPSAARALRQHWGLGEKPVGSMIKLLESKGVRVFSLVENTKNVDAFSCWRNDIPYVFLNTMKSAEHTRFDAAHELGHLLIHRHGGLAQRDAEREANDFASSFLMPRADIEPRFPFVSSVNKLVAAKKRWGVSVAALAYRLHRLGRMSDWQYRSACIEISRRGYRSVEPNEMDRETSIVWSKVFSSLWADRVTKSHIAEALHIPLNELQNLFTNLISTTAPPQLAGQRNFKVV